MTVTSFELLRGFVSYYRRHGGLFALDFSSAVVVSLLELACLVAVKLFIDQLLPTNQFGTVVLASLRLFLIHLINAGLQVVVTYWAHRLCRKFSAS